MHIFQILLFSLAALIKWLEVMIKWFENIAYYLMSACQSFLS